MFIRFENKYRQVRHKVSATGPIFFQHWMVTGILIFAHVCSWSQNKGSFFCIDDQGDTTIWADISSAEGHMKQTLDALFRFSYATAHWELIGMDSLANSPTYQLHKGLPIRQGSIKDQDAEVIHIQILSRLLGWRSGAPFNRYPINENLQRELKSRGVDVVSHQIFFSSDKADLRIQLKKSEQNQFQALLGTLNQFGKTAIIGDVNAVWLNSLKKAERISFLWQRQAVSVQRIHFQFEFPVLFKSPIGINQKFELYRNQNLYFIVGNEGGLFYRLSNGTKIMGQYQMKNHNALIQSKSIRHRLWGLGITQQNHFRNGMGLNLQFQFYQGKKEVISLDDRQKSPLIKSHLDLEFQKKWSRIFFSQDIHQRGLYSTQNTESIERNRMGGVNTIRGFGQESIFCDQYWGSQIETGWNLQKLGTLFVFYDHAWIGPSDRNWDYWQGLGLGGHFNIPNGELEISSGWGIPPGNGLDLRNNMVHIQYQVFF